MVGDYLMSMELGCSHRGGIYVQDIKRYDKVLLRVSGCMLRSNCRYKL